MMHSLVVRTDCAMGRLMSHRKVRKFSTLTRRLACGLNKEFTTFFFQNLYGDFQKLDERISYVATKVVHLGDQLEGVNTPRTRAVEAQRLMNYLSEFLTEEPLQSPVLTDPAWVSQCLFLFGHYFRFCWISPMASSRWGGMARAVCYNSSIHNWSLSDERVKKITGITRKNNPDWRCPWGLDDGLFGEAFNQVMAPPKQAVPRTASEKQ